VGSFATDVVPWECPHLPAADIARIDKKRWVSNSLGGSNRTGTGYGLIGDLVLGITGAFIGDWLQPRIGIHLGTGIVPPPVGKDWVHEIKLDGYRIPIRFCEPSEKTPSWTSVLMAMPMLAQSLSCCNL
jgi:hypothetical protein